MIWPMVQSHQNLATRVDSLERVGSVEDRITALEAAVDAQQDQIDNLQMILILSVLTFIAFITIKRFV